jgi:hypothetical protein
VSAPDEPDAKPPKKSKKKPKAAKAAPAGPAILAMVLPAAKADVDADEAKRGAPYPKHTRQNRYATHFAMRFGTVIAAALEHDFKGVRSGETPSASEKGLSRVDVNYSTVEAGLGFAISMKSVHVGEKNEGTSHFTHNIKRNLEELRVEAMAHHIRQPFAVLVALLFLPFESCTDRGKTSSFASWVRALWALKGREKPEDREDRFELVFIALYARDASELGFYQVGGDVPCPRKGRPLTLLSFEQFLALVKRAYLKRNGRDFYFEGEQPPESETGGIL